MAWRHVIISQPARLESRQGQLVIKTNQGDYTLPQEDISTLLLESRQSTLTTSLLSSLAEKGVALMVCDEKHLPCAVLLPYARHSRPLGVLRLQLSLSKPAKNRLWQQIVQAKINNQARCLEIIGEKAEGEALFALAKKSAVR